MNKFKLKSHRQILNIRIILCIFLVFQNLPSSIFGQTEASPVKLTVNVTGLHNDQGQVLISIYNQSEGFPKKPAKALRSERIKIKGGTAVATFALTPGDYAIAVVHDENSNQDLDTNMVGLPKEGVGVSNNVKGFMGPPKYEDAKFKLNIDGKTIEVKINYL